MTSCGEAPLANVPLFAGLSPALLEEVTRISRVRTYPQGQILFNEGDPGDDLIVLEAGHLRVSRYLADGSEVVLAVLAAPAALGELALLDGSPRDATVTAQRPVTVRRIPRSIFLDLLDREPAMARGLLRSLASMIRSGNERHADFVGLDVPGRLAKWLLRHAGEGTTVRLEASQGEIAAELGTTRSTLNRVLRDFQALGLIAIGDQALTILNPDRLQTYTW